MIEKVPESIKVTYKYDIRMTHILSDRRALLKKWTETYLRNIYYGKYLLLVSPVFTLNKRIFILPTLDVDTTFNVGFNFISKFLRKQRYWYAEFTGKRSFHLYFRYLVEIPPEYNEIRDIRQLILQPFKKFFDVIDSVSSIRNIPTVRIGKRSDVNRLAIPVLYLDKKWILNASRGPTFEKVFPRENDLAMYIRTYLLPPLYVDLRTYYRLVRYRK